MPMQPDQPIRSKEARSAARTLLAELREARLNQRRAVHVAEQHGPASDDPAPEGSASTDAPEDWIEDDIAIARPAGQAIHTAASEDMDACSIAAPQAVSDGDQDASSESEKQEDTAEPMFEPEEAQPAGITDAASGADLMTGTDPAPEQIAPVMQDAPEIPSAEASAPDEPHAARPGPDPLSALPGAGPGLIWMLNKAGIVTLADLAAAHPETLSSQLGLLGEILDLDHWIGVAQEMSDVPPS